MAAANAISTPLRTRSAREMGRRRTWPKQAHGSVSPWATLEARKTEKAARRPSAIAAAEHAARR